MGEQQRPRAAGREMCPCPREVTGWGKGQVWVQILALTLVGQWTGHSISLNLRLKSTSYPPRWTEGEQARSGKTTKADLLPKLCPIDSSAELDEEPRPSSPTARFLSEPLPTGKEHGGPKMQKPYPGAANRASQAGCETKGGWLGSRYPATRTRT